jgi:TetR/AcrR family transcriptional regulator, cholesterol catabolism regulator
MGPQRFMDPKVANIIQRARKMFMQFGIRSVSMDDICRELGMSKKTLYQYFGNKNELLGKALEFGFEEFEESISSLGNNEQNAIDDLLDLSKVIDRHLKEVNPSVTFDLEKYYPELYRENMIKKREFAYRYIRKNIEKGIKENVFRDDLNLDLVSKLYIQKLEDLHDPNYYNADQISFSEVFHVMFENHIRGISNENGIKYFEEKVKILKNNPDEF